VFCAVIGMFLATDGFPGWHVLVCRHDRHLAAGRRRVRRQLPDRAEIDARMARTARRATAMGELSTTQTWCSPPSSAAPAWASCTRWSIR
jgi:protoheme IX farnesyltransferase